MSLKPSVGASVTKVPYLVVGSGLTGATIARILHDSGRTVLVVERRSHLGGNVHDQVHNSGIRWHTYGPHYFRTGSEKIWNFVRRFTEFYSYRPALKSLVEGQLEHWPVTEDYIRRTVGVCWQPSFQAEPTNFEEASLAMMPQRVYELFVKGYTEKQWGVPANQINTALARRFDVRNEGDVELSRHPYQGIPVKGYAHFTETLLQGIPRLLNCDYLKEHPVVAIKKIIFSGPIDEYYGFRFGRLAYRGQVRSHQFHHEQDWLQACGQVNNPNPAAGAHIRTLEWKHMMAPSQLANIRGTLMTSETPYTPSDPEDFEYPFPDEKNARLFRQYKELASTESKLLICGRLGEYRYYDMDQAIARAMLLAERLIKEEAG